MAIFWLAAVVTLVVPSGVRAAQHGPFTYQAVGGEVEITDYTEDVAGAVVIPEQIAGMPVTAIGERAFVSKQLTSVSLPSGLKTIGDYAFHRNGLSEIDIPSGVTDIGTRAFLGNSSLVRASLPEGLLELKSWTFGDCFALTDVTLPSSLKSIGVAAFTLSGLKEIDLPEGLEHIGAAAFESCDLTYVSVPSTVTTIEWSAFRFCPDLKFAEFAGDAPTVLGGNEFSNAHADFAVHFVAGSEGFTEPIWNGYPASSVPPPPRLSPDGKFWYVVTGETVQVAGLEGDVAGEVVVVPQELAGRAVTGIAESAFASAQMIEVSLPPGLQTIGDHAFLGCADLVSVDIPASVMEIGVGAFGSCTQLSSIEIPAGVTDIGAGAFGSCTQLSSIEIPEGVAEILAVTFGGCTALTDVLIPAGVRSIGVEAFRHCSALEQVVLPDGLEAIGVGAFAGAGLRSVVLPSSLTELGKEAFLSCAALESAMFQGGGVEEIPESAFEDCFQLTSIHLQPGLMRIGASAFEGSRFSEVTLPTTVTEIGERAFALCSFLDSVTIPAGVTSIGAAAFFGCTRLESVEFQTTDLTEIRKSTFEGCLALTRLVIPPSVQAIGDRAFTATSALEEIWFIGSAPTLGANQFSGIHGGLLIRVCSSDTFTGFPWNGFQIEEFERGDSDPVIEQIELGESWTRIEMNVRSYRVGIEYSPDLSPGSWIDLGNFFTTHRSNVCRAVFIDPDPVRAGRNAGFYRAFRR